MAVLRPLATLCRIYFLAVGGRDNLPASGTYTLQTDPTWRNTHQFLLTVTRADGSVATSHWITVRFHCPYQYFYSSDRDPEPCPDETPVAIQLVQQDFEHGRMLWFPADGDAYIFILYDDGYLMSPPDTWAEGQPEIDPTIVPPAGLYQPVRGFGKLWREWSTVRERLGWAVAPEQSFTSLYQSQSGTDLKGWIWHLQLVDGRAVKLVAHYAFQSWAYVL